MIPLPPLTTKKLDDVADSLASRGLYPGYPSSRLFIHTPGLEFEAGVLQVPDGPWLTANHPNRQGVPKALLDAEILTDSSFDSSRQAEWQAKGFETDQLGRPLHPYWRQLLSDKRIGLPTGLGVFYRYGPNRMVDPIVYRRHGTGTVEFLLIRKKTSGKWGLPGGFIDPDDSSIEAAARREISEETGLSDFGGSAKVIKHTLPLRQRDTLHAWAETIVILFQPNKQYAYGAPLRAGDDADDAGWFTEEQTQSLNMLDTHPPYLRLAIGII